MATKAKKPPPKKRPKVPDNEPEKSMYYLKHEGITDWNPNNPYQARLIFATLWKRKYGCDYAFDVAARAKTPQGQVSRERGVMADVNQTAAAQGHRLQDVIQAYLDLDNPFLKSICYPMTQMPKQMPAICVALAEKKKRRHWKPSTTTPKDYTDHLREHDAKVQAEIDAEKAKETAS